MDGAFTTPAARCVIWNEPGAATPEALLRALARDGHRHVEADAAIAAFALLCTRVGPHAARAGETSTLILVDPERLSGVADMLEAVACYAPEAVVLEFVERAEQPLRAIAAAPEPPTPLPADPAPDLPATAQPVPIANPITGPAASAIAGGPGAKATTMRLPPAQATPRLRLAGEGLLPPLAEDTPPVLPAGVPSPTPDVKTRPAARPQPAPPQPPAPAKHAPPPNLLTEDELAMLLSDEQSGRAS